MTAPPDFQSHVVVVVRSHFERHGWIHPELAMWMVSLAGEQRYKVTVHCACGAPNAAAAANFAAHVFLTEHPDAEWLCLVDNDSVPQFNMLRMLDDLPDEADIVSGISHMMQDGKLRLQQGWGKPGESFTPITLTEQRGLYEVDRVGGGCWFTRRRVFEKLAEPYFVELFDARTRMIQVSDDIYFQTVAKQAGCRLYCDTRYLTAHCHTVDLSALPREVRGERD